MVYPKIVFLKCQVSEDSDLMQATLKDDFSSLKTVLLEAFNINLNTTKQTYFYSDKSESDSLIIITVDLNEQFKVNTLNGNIIQDLKSFL